MYFADGKQVVHKGGTITLALHLCNTTFHDIMCLMYRDAHVHGSLLLYTSNIKNTKTELANNALIDLVYERLPIIKLLHLIVFFFIFKHKQEY